MRYREYPPLLVKRDLKENLIRIMIESIPLLFGIFFLVCAFLSATDMSTPIEISECSYDQIEDRKSYRFDQLVLVKKISKYTNSNYLVRFTDKNGQTVYATVRVDDEDIQEKCKLIESPSFKVGDVVLSGTFFTFSLYSDYEIEEFDKAYSVIEEEAPGMILYTRLWHKTDEELRSDILFDVTLIILYMSFATICILLGCIRVKHLLRLRKHLSEYLKAYLSFESNQNIPNNL